MQKFLGWLIAVLVVSFAIPLAVKAVSVNDFIIKDFQADYYLDIDSNNRSTLRTVETITALFPDYDQNHGIERALVTTYDGHSTNLIVQSVTNENGEKLSYSSNWQADNLVLRIGESDKYVHGLVTYVISYTQNDVTKSFINTDANEFYWDINGTNWYQPFESVSARIHLSDNIVKKTTGSMSCYYGVSGSSNTCQIDSNDSVIKTTVNNLSPGENVTIAVGFLNGTFAEYKMSLLAWLEKYMVVISILISLLGLVVMTVLKLLFGRDYPSKKAIVPQYLPLKDVDIVLSSVIKKAHQNWVAAALVDLAVRHKLRIIEKEDKKYVLEYLKSDGLNDNEQAVMRAFFGDTPESGATYDIDKRHTNTKLAYKLSALYRQVKRWARKNGYYLNKKALKVQMLSIAVFIFLQMTIILFISKPGITIATDIWPVALFTVIALASVLIVSIKPLSSTGKALLDYLKGLQMYIDTAEKDRLKYLQSPETAARKLIDTEDNKMMLKLYERLLPYAILFGSEKDWVKVIGKYYEEQATQPDWYSGNTVFNAAIFSSAISDFSNNIKNNSYISSSSSSTGGSMGGGSSGGGGGGGGGGGW